MGAIPSAFIGRIFGGRYFRCRQCHGLEYASRNEGRAQCAMHRADRIANRPHDIWKGTMKTKCEFPPKPSRMRWKTNWRLKQRYDELRGRWMWGGTLWHQGAMRSLLYLRLIMSPAVQDSRS
jgi:hypothetical protein